VEDVFRERGATYILGGPFKAFAVRDGRLITGQQQYSDRKVAQMVIEALGGLNGRIGEHLRSLSR
jgi:putative intracellular protease/amidase